MNVYLAYLQHNYKSMKIQYILGLLLIASISFNSCKGGSSNNNNKDKGIDETTGISSIDEITKTINNGNPSAELYYDRSVAYSEVEAYDNAIDDIYKAMRIDSLQPKYYVHLTDLFMSYYRSKQAYQTLRLATERFPRNIDVLLKFAELSITLKQNQKAVQTIQQILELDNQNAQAYFLMGILMQSEGDKERAKSALKKVVEIDPEVVDAYLLLGELYEEDNPAMAEQYLKNALTIASEDINSLHSMAFFQQNNGNIDGALEIYREINILDPTYSPAFLNAGILYLEKEDYEKAEEQFNILVNLEPSDYRGYFYRGLTNKWTGNLEASKSDFENALKFDEENEEIKLELRAVKKMIEEES